MTESRPGPLAPPPGHPDRDALADFDAGVLDPAQSVRLQAHVRGCARCRAVLAGIRDVPHLLRTLPAVQMPAEVEARIFAALAAERDARPGQPAAAPPAAVTSLGAARRRRWLTRPLGVAAAGLILVAGGMAAGLALQGGGGTTDRAGGPGAGGAASTPASTAGTPQIAAPLPSYDRETVTRSPLLVQILNGEHGPLTPDAGAARIWSCRQGVARKVAGTAAGPLGVQHIRFEGRPAYLLAYRTGGRWVLVVVAESCSATDPAVLFSRTG